ncbi:MAG TPA: nicotinate-nucleotide adenylyltransferase [Stellaceae bacterium]|jgi:nicotinate (nicotinamide) nucleotide adenylyltransferase/ribosome silencing factor RsfS/YbeB/iojap|nr:nicotinate-nucleotide adenylyltransferase [Stellaceae bacterium]
MLYGRPHRRIGLLGGSFNPAHGGHLHISLLALQRLDLDEVWWLVSPQNPLKPVKEMAPFAKRRASAEALAKGQPRIAVSAIEATLGTSYTADTIAALHQRFPHTRFVWLMGGDNLAQLPRWKRWVELLESVPVAVFDRPQTSLGALAGKAARRFARARIAADAARDLAEMQAPAWTFFHTRLDPRSATEIRKRPETRAPRATKSSAGKPAKENATVTTLPARRRRRVQPASAPTLLPTIIATLEDGKAEDIVTIDLAGKTDIADYMVIASGRSARQVTALTDHLLEALPKKWRSSVEGKAQGDWVLIDAGDVIVHLFRPEIRAHYNLEKMWGAALPSAEAARQ